MLTPNLRLYSPILEGANFITNLDGYLRDYQHVNRWMGGYWSASGRFVGNRADCLGFYYGRMGCHFEEWVQGEKTWEGFIAELDSPARGRGSAWECRVTILGYAHTLPWRTVSVADGNTSNASVWVTDILTGDCPFVAAQSITANTLQTYRNNDYNRNAWDELVRIAELGDSSGNPWRIWIGNGRTAYYEQGSVTPAYYLHSGMKYRRSLLRMYNYLTGSYSDVAGATQVISPTSNADSITRYGRREQRLYREGLPSATATALAASYLKENAWPWPRAVGTTGAVRLYRSVGDNIGIDNPWAVQPGVVRDLGYPVGGVEYSGWLGDVRDSMIEEVRADASGVSLRTMEFSDADLLEAQFAYAEDTGEADYDLSD